MQQHMNRILIIFVALSWACFSKAAEKEVASIIQSVKVFRQGAQIVRTGKTAIPAGETVLKFTRLSPDLDPQSIQFKAQGSFTILSVSHQINYLKEIEQSEAYQKLVAERDALQSNMDKEEINLQVLNEEESLLLANKDVGGTSGASVEKLKSVAEYYRTRLSEIKLKKLESTAAVKKIQENLIKIQRQINDMSARINQPTSEILIKIQAKVATQGDFELGYLVRSAGWYPAYDLRVKDISSPVELAYKANVFQNTGEDWNKVQLSLSTGNPSRPGTMPDLQTWWLNYYEPIVAYRSKKQDMNLMQKSAPQQAYAQEELKAEEADKLEVAYIEGTTSFEFKIELPYDIPADGKQYTVNVDEYSIPAYYEYYAAPKLDPTAYLTAQLTNWEQYNLLNGEANLYFEGTYLGKSYLNVQSTEDTLTLSLGRDESVVVTRKKEAQNASNQFIGNKKSEIRGWDIELRNKKKQAINIVVEDQYPIATNEEIEVTLESAKNAAIDKESGILKWALKIEPNQAAQLNFRYSVKLPKKKKVILE